MEIRNLISLMPPYYKEVDTHKDAQDKGILERYLSIFGEYYKDEIHYAVGNTLEDILDYDKMPLELINFMWELFGNIPYSYAALMDNSRDAIGNEVWNKLPEAGQLPRADFRNLLRHCISLYKIRGTLDFYPTLLSYYGYEATIRDPTGDYIKPEPSLSNSVFIPNYDSELLYDYGITYDESALSSVCVNVTMTIIISHVISNEFKERLYLLLNRFRPIHVVPFGNSNVKIYTGSEPVNNRFTYTFPFSLT